ncbi:hypothetical protein EVG20_g4895 [Dentipellis fragilis]|uniref:Uncharacterized protein n=1 Tax=Dentipellis fragilis TaxID=205917 RepID=A0A4Y9YUU4_9AGAM|nr:hypothetical protein EVG20_g4895 [Dentipellis fragilis]
MLILGPQVVTRTVLAAGFAVLPHWPQQHRPSRQSAIGPSASRGLSATADALWGSGGVAATRGHFFKERAWSARVRYAVNLWEFWTLVTRRIQYLASGTAQARHTGSSALH